MTSGAGSTRVQWPAVALFYSVACGVSWPLLWWRDRRPDVWDAWAIPGNLKSILPAAGPFLGALCALVLFRRTHPRTITLAGTSRARSALFALVPIGLLGLLFGLREEGALHGLAVGVIFLVYGLGEELGWRGFLQDALRPLPPARRYLLIALLWGAWHFTTFVSGGLQATATRLAGMALLWILGSWGMGRAVDRSRSVLVAAMLHLAFNFTRAAPPEILLPFLGGSAVLWILLLRRWPQTPLGGTIAAAITPERDTDLGS
ncbi:MAG: CPBP family intramembrane glutamic endopeptidase [Byssovorax sp.]